jgi:Bacterial extracellular solute-binding protein, family 7
VPFGFNKVYAQLGVDVKLLPAGEIFPALQRGVIDAAEFVGPYQDRRLGLPIGFSLLLIQSIAAMVRALIPIIDPTATVTSATHTV